MKKKAKKEIFRFVSTACRITLNCAKNKTTRHLLRADSPDVADVEDEEDLDEFKEVQIPNQAKDRAYDHVAVII